MDLATRGDGQRLPTEHTDYIQSTEPSTWVVRWMTNSTPLQTGNYGQLNSQVIPTLTWGRGSVRKQNLKRRGGGADAPGSRPENQPLPAKGRRMRSGAMGRGGDFGGEGGRRRRGEKRKVRRWSRKWGGELTRGEAAGEKGSGRRRFGRRRGDSAPLFLFVQAPLLGFRSSSGLTRVEYSAAGAGWVFRAQNIGRKQGTYGLFRFLMSCFRIQVIQGQ
jgi:hypothetical protein